MKKIKNLKKIFTSWKLLTVWFTIFSLVGILGFGFTTDPKKVPSPLVGKLAPDFDLKLLNSDLKINLSRLKGKAVLLNFWSSWCQECKVEAKVLESFHIKFGLEKEKVKVIGVGVQDSQINAINFINYFGKTYSIGLDDKAGNIALDYGIYGVPETFFIDPDGKIFYKHIGIVSMDLLEKKLQPFL